MAAEKPTSKGFRGILRSRYQAAFLGTVTFEALAAIALVSIVFAIVWEQTGNLYGTDAPDVRSRLKSFPVYLAIFILAMVFAEIMTVDALWNRNIVQLTGICIFQAAMVLQAGLQIPQANEAIGPAAPELLRCIEKNLPCGADAWRVVHPIVVVLPCVIGVTLVVLAALTWKLYKELGWEVFHIVGADIKMRRMWREYSIFVCLLKFDFFFFVGFSMQFLFLVLSDAETEFGLTIAGVPAAFLILLVAVWAVRRELRWLLLLCLIVCLAGLAYFVFKLTRIWAPATHHLYVTTSRSLTIFSAISIVLLVITIGMGFKCYFNFGYGLLRAHGGKDVDSAQQSAELDAWDSSIPTSAYAPYNPYGTQPSPYAQQNPYAQPVVPPFPSPYGSQRPDLLGPKPSEYSSSTYHSGSHGGRKPSQGGRMTLDD